MQIESDDEVMSAPTSAFDKMVAVFIDVTSCSDVAQARSIVRGTLDRKLTIEHAVEHYYTSNTAPRGSVKRPASPPAEASASTKTSSSSSASAAAPKAKKARSSRKASAAAKKKKKPTPPKPKTKPKPKPAPRSRRRGPAAAAAASAAVDLVDDGPEVVPQISQSKGDFAAEFACAAPNAAASSAEGAAAAQLAFHPDAVAAARTALVQKIYESESVDAVLNKIKQSKAMKKMSPNFRVVFSSSKFRYGLTVAAFTKELAQRYGGQGKVPTDWVEKAFKKYVQQSGNTMYESAIAASAQLIDARTLAESDTLRNLLVKRVEDGRGLLGELDLRIGWTQSRDGVFESGASAKPSADMLLESTLSHERFESLWTTLDTPSVLAAMQPPCVGPLANVLSLSVLQPMLRHSLGLITAPRTQQSRRGGRQRNTMQGQMRTDVFTFVDAMMGSRATSYYATGAVLAGPRGHPSQSQGVFTCVQSFSVRSLLGDINEKLASNVNCDTVKELRSSANLRWSEPQDVTANEYLQQRIYNDVAVYMLRACGFRVPNPPCGGGAGEGVAKAGAAVAAAPDAMEVETPSAASASSSSSSASSSSSSSSSSSAATKIDDGAPSVAAGDEGKTGDEIRNIMIDEGESYAKCGFSAEAISAVQEITNMFDDHAATLGDNHNRLSFSSSSSSYEYAANGDDARVIPALETRQLIQLCEVIQDCQRDDFALGTVGVRSCEWSEEMAVIALSTMKYVATMFLRTLAREDLSGDDLPRTPHQLLKAVEKDRDDAASPGVKIAAAKGWSRRLVTQEEKIRAAADGISMPESKTAYCDCFTALAELHDFMTKLGAVSTHGKAALELCKSWRFAEDEDEDDEKKETAPASMYSRVTPAKLELVRPKTEDDEELSFDEMSFTSFVTRLSDANQDVLEEKGTGMKIFATASAIAASKKKKKKKKKKEKKLLRMNGGASVISRKQLFQTIRERMPQPLDPVRSTQRYQAMALILLGGSRLVGLPTEHMLLRLSSEDVAATKTSLVSGVCALRLVATLGNVKKLIYRMLAANTSAQAVLRFLGNELRESTRQLLPCDPLEMTAAPSRQGSLASNVDLRAAQLERINIQAACTKFLPVEQNKVYSNASDHRWLSLFVEPVPHASTSVDDATPIAAAADEDNELEEPPSDIASHRLTTFKVAKQKQVQKKLALPSTKYVELHSNAYERKEAAFKVRLVLPMKSFLSSQCGTGRGSVCILDSKTPNGGAYPNLKTQRGRGRGGYAQVARLSANDSSAGFKQSRWCMQQLILASQQAAGVETGALELMIRATRRAVRECSVAVAKKNLMTFSGVLRAVQHSKRAKAVQPDGLGVQLHSYQLQSLEWMLREETRPGGIASHFWCRIRLPHVASTYDLLADTNLDRVKAVYQKAAALMKDSTYQGRGQAWTGIWPDYKGERPSSSDMDRLMKSVNAVLTKTLKRTRAHEVPTETKVAVIQWVVMLLRNRQGIDKLCNNSMSLDKPSMALMKKVRTAQLLVDIQLRQKHKYIADLPTHLPPRAGGAAAKRGGGGAAGAAAAAVHSADAAYVWYCPLTEEISVNPPEPQPMSEWHRGGFLCEEMGMGKTLITLALILANPAPPLSTAQAHLLTDKTLGRFLKGDLKKAEVEQDKWAIGGSGQQLTSRSTLVVCALSLVEQWVSEAQNRTQGQKSLSIYKYYGPGRQRDPQKLAAMADIVVTTYQILGSDARGNSQKTGAWRNPCAAIKWHRIVLDESHGRAATNSVTKLEAQRRWCVTGTPFCTSVADAQPQLQFLRGSPFAQKSRFTSKVAMGSPELMYTLRQMMMRHTIDQRMDGLPLVALPPKHERVVTVTMTGEERAAYARLAAAAKKRYLAIPRAELRKKTVVTMSMLMPLRRACSGGEMAVPPSDGSEPTVAQDTERSTWTKSARQIIDMNPNCPICTEPVEEPIVTACRHAFCQGCIANHLKQPMENSCPVCHSVVVEKEMKSATVYGDSAAEAAANAAAFMAASTAGGAAASETSAAKRQKTISNPNSYIFEAKLRVLLQELHTIRKKDATAKVLVFTQFKSTLAWLGEQLPKHGLGFRTISGSDSLAARGAALKAFRNDPPTTIFLLSIRTGAVGINLTSASHIFLLEPWCVRHLRYRVLLLKKFLLADLSTLPLLSSLRTFSAPCLPSFLSPFLVVLLFLNSLNPALEVQAIGRAYRMGQTREVHVTRLQVHDSIEGRLLSLRSQGAMGSGGGGAKNAAGSAAASAAAAVAPGRGGARAGPQPNKLVTEDYAGSIASDKVLKILGVKVRADGGFFACLLLLLLLLLLSFPFTHTLSLSLALPLDQEFDLLLGVSAAEWAAVDAAAAAKKAALQQHILAAQAQAHAAAVAAAAKSAKPPVKKKSQK